MFKVSLVQAVFMNDPVLVKDILNERYRTLSVINIKNAKFVADNLKHDFISLVLQHELEERAIRI